MTSKETAIRFSSKRWDLFQAILDHSWSLVMKSKGYVMTSESEQEHMKDAMLTVLMKKKYATADLTALQCRDEYIVNEMVVDMRLAAQTRLSKELHKKRKALKASDREAYNAKQEAAAAGKIVLLRPDRP